MVIFGVGFNLSYIGVFKYADFFVENFSFVLDVNLEPLGLALPLAISFYTFQLIALLVDCSKGRVSYPPPDRLALFVAFFPQLIAGPIVRYDEVKSDLEHLKPIALENLVTGLSLFSIGLFKKAVIADTLAPFANTFFGAVDAGADPGLFEAWGGALLYTFQIYFDFSGYSDMAIGLALIFGIRLPVNFYSPYKAGSIIEFWRHWHMTLSRFLRDYLYIPLGGGRASIVGRWRNVFITMLLGGLWHGASWNFVLWGGMHGILIAGNHAFRRFGARVPLPLGWTLTFVFLVLTWVLFRTTDLAAAAKIYAGMAGLNGVVLPERLAPFLGSVFQSIEYVSFGSSELFRIPALSAIAFSAIIALLMPNSAQMFLERRSPNFTPRLAILCATAGVFGIFGINQAAEFVYFRF